jgi:hypothetical protein
MNPNERGCLSAAERVRIACGDQPTDGQAAHLAQCAACRQDVAGMGELVAQLHDALRPQPVALDVLRTRIHARLAYSRRRRWLRVAFPGALAAAVLLGVLFVPNRAKAPVTEPITPTEAAFLVEVSALLEWDGPAEYALPAIGERVESLAQVENDAGLKLPWSQDENWDVPAQAKGGSSRALPLTDSLL